VGVDLHRSRDLRTLLFGRARDLGIDTVVHMAEHPDASDDGRSVHALNVDRTRELLHLLERHPTIRRIVYRAAAVPDPGLPSLGGLVVAVHSPRAGARLAELAAVRDGTKIAAISEAAAKACGTGWELVEAAARSGAPDAAAAALGQLEERARAAGTDWALGILARSTALLEDGPAADARYRDGLERLERCRIVVHLARAHLVYGEWRRRGHRRIEAREHLRNAYEMLGRIGAEAFAAMDADRRRVHGPGSGFGFGGAGSSPACSRAASFKPSTAR
jgi:nucleoside-diphosphate-sugar epimerase